MKHSQNILPDKKFLNISDFSKRYLISRPSTYKLIKEGRLPTKMIGKRLHIDVSNDKIIKTAINSLSGPGEWSRNDNYKPKRHKHLTPDEEFDLQFEAFEKKEAEKREKRRLARIKCK